jgi:hypothetical protein
MPIKVTMVFTQSTNKNNTTVQAVRVGGWSESHYWPNQDFAAAISAANVLASMRAALLTPAAFITGLRFQQVAPVGPSQSLQTSIAGTSDVQADIPQMALQINIPGNGVRNISRIKLRGIPDARVVEGELSMTNAFQSSLGIFVSQLRLFQFYGRDLSLPSYPLLNILADGTFFTEGNTILLAGDMVRVMRTVYHDGTFRGGRFQIASMAGLKSGILRNWPGDPVKGGKIREDGNAFFTYASDSYSIGRISTKKVGRPSTGYVGRR